MCIICFEVKGSSNGWHAYKAKIAQHAHTICYARKVVRKNGTQTHKIGINKIHYIWNLNRKFSGSLVGTFSFALLVSAFFPCHDNVFHHKCTYIFSLRTSTTKEYGNCWTGLACHRFAIPGHSIYSTSIVLRVYSDWVCLCHFLSFSLCLAHRSSSNKLCMHTIRITTQKVNIKGEDNWRATQTYWNTQGKMVHDKDDVK